MTLAIVLVAPACSGTEPASSPPGPDEPRAHPAPAPAPADGPGARPEPADADAATPPAPLDTAPAKLLPVAFDCTSDADCTLHNLDVNDDRCCYGCLVHVSNTRWKEHADAYCAAHPAPSCPKKRCGSAPAPTCRDGRCIGGT